jgi:hypothetical protein
MEPEGQLYKQLYDYFYHSFPAQLAKLDLQTPNETILEVERDSALVFSGGREWEHVRADLAKVPEADRSLFILSLFMVVLTDQALYTYFPQSYETWRQHTMFPKFGWSGFGPHNENPFWILRVPEREGLIASDAVIGLIPEFVRFLAEETTTRFRQWLPAIDVTAYFNALRGDKDYAADFAESTIIPRFKKELDTLTRDRSGATS